MSDIGDSDFSSGDITPQTVQAPSISPDITIDPDDPSFQTPSIMGGVAFSGGDLPMRTGILGRAIDGGSTLGNLARQIPLVGGILGNVGDMINGAGNLVTGNISTGAHEITGGVAGLGQIGASDALAASAGALGKLQVTGTDLANLASGGTLVTPDQSSIGTKENQPTGLLGAAERLGYDFAIPTYGMYSGANYGSTQLGDEGPFFNQADDAARVHDAHLNDGEWIANQWNPAPDGIIPSGPVGIANFLLGAIPFWLHNGQGQEADPAAVTMTK